MRSISYSFLKIHKLLIAFWVGIAQLKYHITRNGGRIRIICKKKKK